MKSKVFSEKEANRWNRAFWIGALTPIALGFFLWGFVDLLNLVGLCEPSQSWPPPCIVMGANIGQQVGNILTTMGLGFVQAVYEPLFFLLYGIIILTRIIVLKRTRKHGLDVMT